MGQNKQDLIGDNRFDFLRLSFASIVFFYHFVFLARFSAGQQLETFLSYGAKLSIEGFFVISGALVYGSLTRSKTVGQYAAKRVRRLYPAYIVIIAIPALISLFMGGALNEVLRYLGANLVFLNFLEPNLPGLFEGHRVSAVNGALWTLKIEVMFYMILPILGWALALSHSLHKWAHYILLGLIYISAELWRARLPSFDIPYADMIARQLPGQMSFFAAGIVLWMLKDKIKQRVWLVGILGLITALLSLMPTLEFLRAIGIACLVGFAAYAPGPKLRAAKYGDISYGVYITHFPIINGLIAAGLVSANSWLGFVITLILVYGASLILWRFIERPFLYKSRALLLNMKPL